jgi:hemolysin III
MTGPLKRLDPMISSPDSNEYVSAISHLIGAIASIAGLAVLVSFAALEQKWLHTVGFGIYGTSLLLSLVASCLLHFFLLFGIYKRIFGILDHCAIYVLIAGTYTPFCLTVVGGIQGWLLLGAIWALAATFIALKAVFFAKIPPLWSNISYIMMGWLSLLVAYPIYVRLGWTAVALMAVGGLLYTVGAVIFARGTPNPRPPYFGNHDIWHLSVLAGNSVFFMLMLLFVLPLPR